jgi:hypothetical protein
LRRFVRAYLASKLAVFGLVLLVVVFVAIAARSMRRRTPTTSRCST